MPTIRIRFLPDTVQIVWLDGDLVKVSSCGLDIWNDRRSNREQIGAEGEGALSDL